MSRITTRRPAPSRHRRDSQGEPVEGKRTGWYFNPLLVVTGWIVLGGALFSLGWSELYPGFSWGGASFLVLAAGLFGILGLSIGSTRPSGTERATTSGPVWLISGYFVAASLLNGGVPLMLILLGRPYDIYSFGIPLVHVAMLAFTGYYGVRLMADFLETRDRRLLLRYAVVVGWLVLIASRGAVSFLIFASLVLVLRRYGFSLKRLFLLIVLAVAFLFGFGVFGDQRLAFQINQATGNQVGGDAILSYAHASDSFVALGIPPTFMWAYLYLSSPIANLLSAFEHTGASFCGERCDFQGLFVYALMPDMVGTRLGTALDISEFDKSVFLVAPDLTASTVFGSAVGYAGLAGALTVTVVIAALVVVTLARLRHSDIHESGIAILATVLFFCCFENMIKYSPMSLQLFIVLLVATRRPSPFTLLSTRPRSMKAGR